MTKQGVRDLGGNNRRPRVHEPIPRRVRRSICAHSRMTHSAAGLTCIDCGASAEMVYDYVYDHHYRVWR
jgi:hypothetical protein